MLSSMQQVKLTNNVELKDKCKDLQSVFNATSKRVLIVSMSYFGSFGARTLRVSDAQ